MAQKSSAVPWLIGCGVVAVVFLLACGGVVYFVVHQAQEAVTGLSQMAQQEIKASQQRASFANSWRSPPADTPREQLFPESVGTRQRTALDEQATISEFNIDLPGHRANYESATSFDVEVFVYRVTALELEAILGRVRSQMESDNYTRKMSADMTALSAGNQPQRFYFAVSPPAQSGWLWWKDGWLFVFRSNEFGENYDDFMTKYLTAIQPEE